MFERITTENPQGNMGNMFNATKIINREVYLRDWNGEGDLNLVDFCKARYKEIWGEDFDKEMDEKVGAEDFGEYMDDDSLLSAFYWITVGYAELRSRLAAYEDSGLSPEEVQELAKAEAEGRLMVLFPVDTEVYIVQDGEILAFRIYEFSLLSINNQNVRYWAECVSDENEDCLDFWTDEIGEAVYLTREAAEKVLGVGDNG